MIGEARTGDIKDDLLAGRYEIKYEQEVFFAQKSGPRIDFFVRGQTEPFGHIRLGGPRSGAIWVGEDCIGEFEQVEKEWFVTPVVDGRLRADQRAKVHPISFLLQKVVGGSKKGQ